MRILWKDCHTWDVFSWSLGEIYIGRHDSKKISFKKRITNKYMLRQKNVSEELEHKINKSGSGILDWFCGGVVGLEE